MFRQKPQPSPSLVQSEWWERLASITADTHNSEPPETEAADPSAEAASADTRNRINIRRGFRFSMRKPLFSFRRLITR